MDRADFYTLDEDRGMVWLGSVTKFGDPSMVPAEILIQNGLQNFEFELDDYLECHPYGVKASEGWPWEWEDSQMTDYAYLFIPSEEMVFFSMMEEDRHTKLYAPIKIKLGYGLDESFCLFREGVLFPNMKKGYLLHGFEYPQTIQAVR
jgi:hypothetical protein